jgi:serine/threonine protein kinase
MNRFIKIEKLGEGTFGVVHKVRRISDNRLFAMKECKSDPNELTSLLTEALILKQSKHDNIIFCDEIFFDLDKIVFILELGSTDLNGLLKKYPNFRKNCQVCVIHILQGLNYLHTQLNVIHCDLKPINILLCNKTLKICDFNSAQISRIHDTPGCTRWYCAPESLLHQEYTTKSDIWSVGCIMFEILTGNILFPGDDIEDQLHLIIKQMGSDDYTDLEQIYGQHSRKKFKGIADKIAINLLTKLLHVNPLKRITAEQALKHPYLHYVE